MFESILLEASDALLTQQAEIKRLHSIIRWCKTRLDDRRAAELETLLREIARMPPTLARSSRAAFARPDLVRPDRHLHQEPSGLTRTR